MPAGVDKKGKKFIIRSRFNCYRERKMTNIVTMIPVRMASTRLPNKPLLDINGKSLLQRVYENVKKTVPGDVFVAAGRPGDRRSLRKIRRESRSYRIPRCLRVPTGSPQR